MCLYVCGHTCSLIHVCVCVGIVGAAYPFSIPMKLNQHFSFVFALALWTLHRPLKDNSAILGSKETSFFFILFLLKALYVF